MVPVRPTGAPDSSAWEPQVGVANPRGAPGVERGMTFTLLNGRRVTEEAVRGGCQPPTALGILL